MTGDFDALFFDVDRAGTGMRSVLVLALLLCLVFFLAVGAYAYFAREEAESGVIPGAVAVLRDFVSENESVAVFLGFSSVKDESVEVGEALDPAYETRVKEKAAAYIAEKEGART